MFIDVLIYLTVISLVLTKLADCISTQLKIKSIGHETNPIARILMARFGIKGAIWLVFVISLLIIVISAYLVLEAESMLLSAGYITVGLFVSTVQAAVAHQNFTGSNNMITRRIFSLLS
ncbi:hypothetical protein [Paraferrimonas sp. SM1919]|uniref:hypothetical protein n=1 Tax=Paraferrimonas sp. SM1919 TaxID=2662263 RepID=UPI0013D7BA3F|nr:hypothetical protein [Paraferrimonas sp. SM1919]